ncbi:hypothetical protein RclHR1_17710010 [Rhizophagus clarus]|uniref:Uncharacterized protein n=1 Tax=Rhizophagus clarus TaxID=94130 RepID=A0A2Z6RDV6_9GLOM|nr:hypothetical protein RclHR1_17710010 [Rhizophagus clarus]
MDAAMEQIIGFRGHTLQWNLPDNTNKLYHRCGKLDCAPNQCPSLQDRERSRSGSRSRSRSKDPSNSQPYQSQKPLANAQLNHNPRRDRSKSNDKCDRSVSFSAVLRTPPLLSTSNQSSTMSPHDAANILSLLKSLQQDMAEVRDRITALELNNRRMTRIEQHLSLLPPPDIPATNQTSAMLIDAPPTSDSTSTSTVALVLSRPTTSPVPTRLNPLSPGFTPSCPLSASLSAPIVHSEISSSSPTS